MEFPSSIVVYNIPPSTSLPQVPPPNPQAPPPSHYLLIGTVGGLRFSNSTPSTSYMVDIMKGDEYSLTVHAVNSVGVGPGSLPIVQVGNSKVSNVIVMLIFVNVVRCFNSD